MMDDRIPFPRRNTLYLGGVPYRLMGDPVKEGDVIAYKASAPGMGVWNDILIREYFPAGLQQSICRKNNGDLACEKIAQGLFESNRAVFLRGEQAEAEYVSSFLQETGVKTACYDAYGTSYSVRVLPKTITLEMFMEQNSGGLSLKKGLPWIMALVDFLDKIHRQGLLHLRVMPSQIYLLGERAVFLDHVCFWKKGSHDVPESHGREISYMAPEIRLQNAGDFCPATDLYSVALIFYRLLYGHHPQKNFGLVQESTKMPSDLAQALWFRKSLHILPRKRFPTAAAFKTSLLHLEHSSEQASMDDCAACPKCGFKKSNRQSLHDYKSVLG